MATLADSKPSGYSGESTRFFTIMACIMSLVIVAGFSIQLAMGRSSFNVPWPYHVHGVIFMSWLGLYLAQHLSMASGNKALHVRLGKLSYIMIPAMVAAGTLIMITVAQRTGGPFFFHVSEFLWSNLALVWLFGGLAFWSLKSRRYTGWHRRLMLCAMAILTGPGLGRLLPLPLMIPHAWTITTVSTMIFPVIGIIVDWRKNGRVHPAYFWGLGLYVVVFLATVAISHTGPGMAVTEWLIEGTPGADRPIEAFLPPGFSM